MDTKKDSAVSDVPTFKVARVGNDRKRKGGGLSFLRGGGTRGVWSGAAGGAGGAGGAAGGIAALAGGFNMSTAMLVFLVAVTGMGLAGLGRYLGGMSGNEPAKPKTFAMASHDVKLEGDTSNLPGNTNTIPNSLGYLTGSRDGLTPEERAKKAAEDAAAAEAQRKADEEAAKKAEKDNLAGKAVDPKDLLASAKADGGKENKGSGFGKKFGSLTSSFGGGSSLSGGAGLSGGVNRQFGGGGSMSKAAPGGKMSAMSGASRPTYAKGGNSRAAASATKGFARKQLANANAYSRRGAGASKGETSSSDAATAFDNNPGAGNVISGPGIGKGAGPKSGSDSTPNPGDGAGNGSPTGSTPTDCGANNYQAADGSCQPIKTDGGQSANKLLDMLCMLAQGLLAVIAAIALITAVMDGGTFTLAYGEMLGGVMAALGGIIALLGVAIIAMGDYAQGTVFTLTGGFIAATALIPYLRGSILNSGTMIISAAAGMVLGAAAKMLDGTHKDKAPEAAQQ
jgi:hypothetical protein